MKAVFPEPVGPQMKVWPVSLRPPPSASLGSLACSEKRSEEHTSELQSRGHLVCRLLLEKKKKIEKWQSAMKWRKPSPSRLSNARSHKSTNTGRILINRDSAPSGTIKCS